MDEDLGDLIWGNECSFEFFKESLKELKRARKKFTHWPAEGFEGNVALAAGIMVEEAGEVLKAANNRQFHGGSLADVREELVQTMAMCLRMAINLEDD